MGWSARWASRPRCARPPGSSRAPSPSAVSWSCSLPVARIRREPADGNGHHHRRPERDVVSLRLQRRIPRRHGQRRSDGLLRASGDEREFARRSRFGRDVPANSPVGRRAPSRTGRGCSCAFPRCAATTASSSMQRGAPIGAARCRRIRKATELAGSRGGKTSGLVASCRRWSGWRPARRPTGWKPISALGLMRTPARGCECRQASFGSSPPGKLPPTPPQSSKATTPPFRPIHREPCAQTASSPPISWRNPGWPWRWCR